MKKIGIFWGSSTENTTVATTYMKEYLEMNDHQVTFIIWQIQI